MRKVILALAILMAAAGVVAVGGCRREPEKPALKIPHVQSENAPKQLKKGPDTVVPDNVTLDAYVQKYYEAYKNKNWKEAYEMQSAARKAQENFQAFTSARSGMPLDSFKVESPIIANNTAEVKAELMLTGMSAGRPWITTWLFSKKGDKWIVEGTKSAMKQ